VSQWPIVRLGKVLSHRKEFIEIIDHGVYKRCRVQLHGNGIVLRDQVPGADIKTKRQQVCRVGEFLVAEIDAKLGGYGIVPPELEGAIVSSHYFLFGIDERQLDRRFLGYFIRTPAFHEQVVAQGSTNYAAIRPGHVLEYHMPLPPLAEQRRLVDRIDTLTAKTNDVKRLRSEIGESQFPALIAAIQRSVFQGKAVPQDPADGLGSELLSAIAKQKQVTNAQAKRGHELPPVGLDEQIHPIPNTWAWARLGDLCTLITDGTHLTPRYVEEGRPFLSAQNVKPFRFMPEYHRKVSEADYQGYVARVKPEKGDILMTRVGAMIGEAAIIDQDIDFAFYVSLCLIKPLRTLVHVPYIVHWLNSPYGALSAKGKTLGKGHSQGNLNLNLIRRFAVPLPPLPEQLRIVDYLEKLRLRSIKQLALSSEIEQELEAFLPAILDRAFRGGHL
jgi:type I restriction enzyme S subunit